MTMPTPHPIAATLQHFAGQLVGKDIGSTQDLHQISLALQDEAGDSHIVYIAHGRGADAAARCQRQYDSLQIGLHYFGSATLHRRGDLHTYWMGTVQIKPCLRRQRFAPLAAAAPALAADGATA